MNSNKKIVVSFSGGRTSAFMGRYIQENVKYTNYETLFLFANTGKENEATLEFVNRCDKEFGFNTVWLEAEVNPEMGKGTGYRVVTFETASRNGEPFEDVIKKYGLPSKLFRHCTRELKERPISKYATKMFGNSNYVTAIGIRADEKHRLGSNPKNVYPLAEINTDETFIRNWWDRQSFDLELKDYEGNCDLCFLKSIRKKLTILHYDESKAVWWADMETKYSSEKQNIMDVYRDNSISDLVAMAQEPFSKAHDKHELHKSQQSLFDPDMEFDCFCKST